MARKKETQTMVERQEIDKLFESLLQQPKHAFPLLRQSVEIPAKHGVYVIYHEEDVLHVGRTTRAKEGLQQRLRNHLQGKSSFVRAYLSGDGNKLRSKSVTFQYLEVPDPRKRALLESLSIGKLCPQHIGVGVDK
jgi:hypothetical protein